jgi:hypothetical protein
MCDSTTIVRDRQKLVRREMDRRGISVKAVQLDGGWETASTVLSYFPADKDSQPAVMSVAALYRLIDTQALPVDLLSLLLPTGFQIVRAPEEINHDEFETMCRDYLAAKARAHQANSPNGRELAPSEIDELDGKVVQLRAAA